MTNKLMSKIQEIKDFEESMYSQIIDASDKIKQLLPITEKQFEDLIIYQDKFEIKFDKMPYKIVLSTQKLDFIRDLFFILPASKNDFISSFIFIENDIKNQIMQELENGNYEVITELN